MEVNKNTDIIDYPPLRYFKSGIQKQGYWNNSQTKLRFEDVIDCLIYLFPQFDFVFLFYQSSGHTKMRGDGLQASNLNVIMGVQ